MHRERRQFLRGALKELFKVLEDEPGLLGPKVKVQRRRKFEELVTFFPPKILVQLPSEYI